MTAEWRHARGGASGETLTFDRSARISIKAWERQFFASGVWLLCARTCCRWQLTRYRAWRQQAAATGDVMLTMPHSLDQWRPESGAHGKDGPRNPFGT